MTAKIQKWGNSQGLKLARRVLEESGMGIGDEVEVIASEIIIRTKPARLLNLKELVARMPKDYVAEEGSFGPPVGREEW
ncbi:MAG: transcriptional regulator/antitoxin, MazE [Acidobacteriota bacterium]|nr:MAG: transcriptional regulator/antitoxin, MazE [Acidobacteriota bacterium]